MKYCVTILVDCTISVVVEADSEDRAKQLAMDEAASPNVCHSCAREMDVGDPIEAIEAYPQS